MDAYMRAALFAAAGVLLIASPYLWGGIDSRRHRRRAERAEAVKRVREWRAQLLELEDRVALEQDRNRVLRSRLMDPAWRFEREAVADEAYLIVRAEDARVGHLYVAPVNAQQ